MRNKIIHGVFFILAIAAGQVVRSLFGWDAFFIFAIGLVLGILQSGAFAAVISDWENKST